MARKALIEAVLSKIVLKRNGPKCWFEKLPPAARRELTELREFFYEGDHGLPKKSFALGVIEVAKERGWKIAGVQQVVAWLNDRA